MLCGTTCGRTAAKADVSHRGRCTHYSYYGCGETAPAWVHRCAFVPLCGSCRERACKGCPKARWALRQSQQLLARACVIHRNLQGFREDGVWCPSEPTTALRLLLWWAAVYDDSRVLWLWHHRLPCGEAAGFAGDAA